MMIESTKVTELKGIGDKSGKLMASLGIETVRDLLFHYPRAYERFEDPVAIGDLEEGKIQTIKAYITGKVQSTRGKSVQITTTFFEDETGRLKAVWFRMPYMKNCLKRGEEIILRGYVAMRGNQLVMEQGKIYTPQEYEKLQGYLLPVYHTTKGLSNNLISKGIRQVIDGMTLREDSLPGEIRKKYSLCEINYALRGIHFPLNVEEYYQARKRLVFNEFLDFILSLKELKIEGEKWENEYPVCDFTESEELKKNLPFSLTNAQEKVWNEIKADLASQKPMSRLVQGDVGSGKTILAVLGLISVAAQGFQGAMMAPTEVLARQHYGSIVKLLEEYHLPYQVVLLTGSLTEAKKREAYERIEKREASIIIGTHALIQEKVIYDSLALVITDEQHRFGVKQRESFANKGKVPHILVMSATPIPRTLAIILYGDLDISVVDELPKNRLPIKNCVVGVNYRKTAYRFMMEEVKKGRQCYVICPMVEESEGMEAENVLDYAKTLKDAMGSDFSIDFLHGKMKQKEKDEKMEGFVENKTNILVSTTVIEVGIDVPNATVILIENAERFGLAQLHQLRGRVGRGEHQSYCIFMTPSKSSATKERLEILNNTNDGFKIASEDLRLRGPGDLFGIRQSGLLNFKLGDVFQDSDLLKMAKEVSETLELKSNITIDRGLL
ncbi:ATP-dependent DNA helicase RecG [Aequitasia blattaphilus]